MAMQTRNTHKGATHTAKGIILFPSPPTFTWGFGGNLRPIFSLFLNVHLPVFFFFFYPCPLLCPSSMSFFVLRPDSFAVWDEEILVGAFSGLAFFYFYLNSSSFSRPCRLKRVLEIRTVQQCSYTEKNILRVTYQNPISSGSCVPDSYSYQPFRPRFPTVSS